jgi:hypothetical protein
MGKSTKIFDSRAAWGPLNGGNAFVEYFHAWTCSFQGARGKPGYSRGGEGGAHS